MQPGYSVSDPPQTTISQARLADPPKRQDPRFERPASGKIAVKKINHYGVENDP
jgi:hypothetical protein